MKLDGSVNENMLSRGTTPVKLIKITTLTSNGYIYRFFFATKDLTNPEAKAEVKPGLLSDFENC